MRHGRFGRVLLLVLLLSAAGFALAQPPKQTAKPPAQIDEPDDKNKVDADEERDRAVADRFRRVLENSPRRGTALDRLYGYHVERGTLDKLVGEYVDRTKKDPKDGVAHMIVGLIESQRGRDAAAVLAFQQAEANLPENAMASYYLGQSLILVGQPETAAAAFERGITRKPNRNDLLDIFQALGRVYQRSQQSEKALEVWNRLEKLYPDDARVQEQIASTLVEEGQFDQALPRLTKLADQADDKYRQTSLRMDAADLKVKLKKTTDAIADFEKLLSELNPDSWLHRDVRRRIEEVFLRNDDLAGLAKYYEKWLEKNKTDVDAIARLAKTLATQGRAPEARDWLSKGVAVAPNHRALRQALIDQFVFEQNFVAAAQQYEAMDKADPNNPDTLREWGKLLMRDISKPEAERRAAASAIWKRLLAKKPNDPVVASQTADLMRTAGASEDAIALYKKAIEVAPNAAQYREYLGEYYHSLKRPEDALATWRPIAEGANRTSKNLARLAEVFAGFGYRKEATAAMAEAISLEKDDFTMIMTYAQLLHEENSNDEALKQITLASKLASNPEESEQVLIAQIKIFQATDALGARIDELQAELDAGTDASADRWLRLARYFEANRQVDKAAEVIAKAQAKDPKSVPALIAGARLYESVGNLLVAADTNRKLAALDRRYRTEYLTAVTKLEQRLGRREQAMQAARDLLAASPGNPDVYKFFSDLCFQMGDPEEGLEALRRSVRANPSDPQGLITLASALGERVRQGEAIELLWRALDKTPELDQKLAVVERITHLYLENNQFDRLLERLERERREAEKAREATLCIAQAYTTAGDLGAARQQLERLLTENTRDTHLLGQLSTLCEQEGDVPSAVKYQRQLNAAAPSNYDHQLRLAQLLTRSGEADEAADIWVRLVSKDTEQHRNLMAIDSLLTATKYEAGVAIISRMLLQKPGNWELLYREGAALAAIGKKDEAAARFNAILALKLTDDDMSEIIKHQIEQAKKKPLKPTLGSAVMSAAMANRYDEWSNPPLTRRTSNMYRIRQALDMDGNYSRQSGMQPFYTPSDYGEARMACLGWLYEFARAKGTTDSFIRELRLAKDKAGAEPRHLWDWYYFNTLRSEGKQLFPTAIVLAKGSDPAGLLALINAVASRSNSNVVRRRSSGPGKDTTPPLPADQLNLLETSYLKLKQLKPDWAPSAVQSVMTELKRAGKVAEEKTLYQELLKDANVIAKVQAAMTVAGERADLEGWSELYNRLEKLQPPAKTTAMLAQLPTRQISWSMTNLMGKLADEKRFDDVRKAADLFLSMARRQNMTAVRSVSAMRRQQGGGFSVNPYTRNNQYRNIQVTYPSPNDYYDQGSLTVLYNEFDIHKSADVVSDLVAQLEKRREAARGAERIYLQLALGYVHWWALEKDEAIAELNQAVQAAPNDHNLLLEVVSLRELNGDFEAGMTLLDSFTPMDMQTMQRREEAALRLAERTGDLERARKAADRLFGLRLDADKQLELAGKMHRLGMHELAETVLGRAQRQAGNKTATMLRLMTQYQSQNQIDLAVQIARQILRRGPSIQTSYRRDENDGARSQAINVLARSGQLKEMIERAEAQLKASPKSEQIYQALVGYYQAAGDKKKLKDALLKIAELKPKDGKVHFQAAEQLVQMGERDAAMAEYKVAIKLEPGLFGNNYWQIQNLFSQANKFEELVQVFDEIDMRKIGSYWSITQPISSLLQQENGKELGLKLFRKAWEAFPQYRSSILGNLNNEELWRLPEIYTYAKEAVIPREDSEADPWQAATDYNTYGQEGRIEGILTRMMSIARKQQRLPELRAEVSAALKKRPDWAGGKALLAIIDVQMGAKEQGKKEWSEVFDDPKGDIPGLARFIMSQELEFYAGMENLAVKALEGGIDEVMRDGNFQYSYSPARRLVWWYELMGRKEDAKKMMLRFALDEQTNPGYGGGYWEYQRAQNGISIAQQLVQQGDPVEAVRIYNRLLADTDLLEQANQYGGQAFDVQVEQGLKAAVKALKPSALPSALNSLIVSRDPKSADKAALDLVLVVESRDLGKATLNSLFAEAIKSTSKAPEIRREAMNKLAELTRKYPADHSVLTANVLAAFADGSPAGIQEAVDRLVKLIESTPLEKLPANGKSNARQRAVARLYVPIWLAARECLAKDREQLWPAGDKLAAYAAAAAKRQQDPLLTVAIYREWGQLEIDRGAKEKGEAHWAELMEWSLPKQPKPGATATGAIFPAPAPAIPAPPSSSAVGPLSFRAAAVRLLVLTQQIVPLSPAARSGQSAASTRTNGLAPTEEEFKRAYEIALLAIDKQMPALSLRTMAQAVRGGPPIVVNTQNRNNGGGPLRMQMIGGTQYYVQGGNAKFVGVDRALLNLVPKWRAQNVPAEKILEVLVGAVLPPGRPAEVFLYPPTQNYGVIYSIGSNGSLTPATDVEDGSITDRGLGKALIQAAVDADKVDDLRKQLEARASQPLGELPAKILLLMLAMNAKDEARANTAFAALGERLKKDSLQSTNAAIAAVLVPALLDPVYAKSIAPLVDKAAQNYVTGGSVQQATDLRFKLAEYYLLNKDEAAARAEFKLVESSDKKIGPQGYDVHLALASEYLKLGWVADALRELGIQADNPANQVNQQPFGTDQRSEPAMNAPGQFQRLTALFLNRPAAERYELLRSWSLPAGGRKSIRYYVGGAPLNIPPEIFAKRLPIPEGRTINTLLLLAEAAKEAGKIDELKTAAASFVKDKVENAELLQVLIHLVSGGGKEAEPAVKAYAQTAQKRLTKKPEIPLGSQMYYGNGYVPPVIYHPSEYLFATLCLNDPVLANYGEGLLATMQATQLNGFDGTFVRKVLNDLKAKRAGAPNALSTALPLHWQTSTGKTNWIAEDGYLSPVVDNQASPLLFDAPLTGTFELSVESWPLTFGCPGYGGLIFRPGFNQVESVVTGDTIQPNPNSPYQGNYYPQFAAAAMAGGQWQQGGTKQTGFGKITLQVAPGKIRCLNDGKLFYEDTNPAPTSPWLSLNGAAVYRNVSISGKPEVPTEIKLTTGDYLEGWQGFVYGGTLPRRLVERQKALGLNSMGYNRWVMQNDDDEEVVQITVDPVYDWLAKDGEIRGRKLDWPGEKASPSCLAYFRRLQPGEKVRYEFFYEPGKTHVYPSLGRVAFLLEPDGLKLHWMTDPQGDEWTGLKNDNAIAPANGSSGQKLKLQSGAWNTASVALNNDSATIELNGAVVYQAKLDQLDERHFGFFHYRDKSDVRIRNVVLTGNWPKSLANAENLSLAAKPSTPAEVKVRRSVMSESLFASEANSLLERARKLPAKERFDLLAAWVLPNERRPTYQLAGLLKPRDVLGVVDRKQQPRGRRVLLGGKLDLPCLEMIAAAKESGNLDALCARLAKPNATPEDELDRRARLAVGAAALAAKGDDKAASDNLRELLTYVVKMKLDAPGLDRWADLIAGHGALDRPALNEPVLALLQAANKNLEDSVTKEKPFEQRDWWLRAFREVRGRAELKHLPEAERPLAGAESRFVHWVSVPTIHDRAMGAGVPHWVLRDGALVHLPGHSEDYLILDTPLRGEFEVTCELKLGGWQEMSVRYGSHQFELQHDRKHYKLQTNVVGGARESLILPPLPAAKDTSTYQFRLAVKDGWFRAFVDGRELAAEKIGPDPDPWLMLSCSHLNTGTIKNFKIAGSPTVPNRIDLLLEDDLGMWQSEPTPPWTWTKRGEEMYHLGKKPEPPAPGMPVPPRNYPEAATFYHRPLLEDGAVEYEFFYDPDKALVHPMLDRLTFLLEPEGVKLHWLTDGMNERTEIAIDNTADEPACRRGPTVLDLKPKSWNKVRLAVSGDVVKVALNGAEIYERPIEPTNQRLFGLFHYTDRMEARVRSMTYLGAWSKKLPTDGELFEVKK